MHRVRCLSTAPRRVLCSLDDLQKRSGRAIKFPLAADATSQTKTKASRRGGRTGLVFYCEQEQAPRAFVNSCPHARLELDLDDSDFFCDGFLQCKAHGAMFDPLTGICLQGPAASRRGRLDQQLGALTELPVRVEGSDVVLLSSVDVASKPDDRCEQEWRDYRAQRQRDLATVMAARADDVERMQQELHAKTMARLRQYAVTTPSPNAKD